MNKLDKFTTFDDHLDDMYGKIGTKKRSEFERGYQEFALNELLKTKRERAGITQKELAKRMHTTATSVSRWENHAQNLKITTLYKYAKALGKKLEIRIV